MQLCGAVLFVENFPLEVHQQQGHIPNMAFLDQIVKLSNVKPIMDVISDEISNLSSFTWVYIAITVKTRGQSNDQCTIIFQASFHKYLITGTGS